MVVILDAFDLDFKLAKRSKFNEPYLQRLLDIDEDEHSKFLETYCREIDPQQLRTLVPGTQITYVRRDNGKIVSKAVIVEHKMTRDNEPLTMLSFGAPTSIPVGKRAIDRGFVRVPQLAPMRFFISADNLEKLYVMKGSDSSETIARIESMNAQMNMLASQVISGSAIIIKQTNRIDQLETDVSAMKKEIVELSRLCLFLSAKLKETVLNQSASNDAIDKRTFGRLLHM